MTITIAIVGGGAAGVSVLTQLTEKYIKEKLCSDKQKIQFLVIEKSGTIGAGLAYGTDDKSHIINLNAECMSPIPDDPKHFIKWVKANPSKWQSEFPALDINNCPYPPRKLFRLYLSDLAITTQQRAKENGIIVKFIEDEAVDIQAKAVNTKDTKFEISLASINGAMKIVAEQVILCIGHLPPADYREFISKPNYFHSPWPIQQFISNVPKYKDVHVIGTRLTAIDVVLTLVSNGHTGKITMVSRSGMLPCVIGASNAYTKQYLTLEAISEITANGTQPLPLATLLELFKKEMEFAEKKSIDIDKLPNGKPVKSAKDWLEREISRAKNEIRPWQSVLGSLYPIVPNIWNALTNQDKKEFLKKYYSLWMTYLAAFPIENAKKILDLLISGQLIVVGGLESISFQEQKQYYEVLLNDGSVIQANYLINGTGAGHDVTKADSKLLENLLVGKLITPHPLGGIEIDFVTLNVISNTLAKRVIENFFVVGDVTWGACMATADLGQIGREAKRVVNSSVKQLFKAILLFSEINGEKMQTEIPGEMRQFVDEAFQRELAQFFASMRQTLCEKYVSRIPISNNNVEQSPCPPDSTQSTKKPEFSLFH